ARGRWVGASWTTPARVRVAITATATALTIGQVTGAPADPLTSRMRPPASSARSSPGCRRGRRPGLGGRLHRLGQLAADGAQRGDGLLAVGLADRVVAELGPLEQPGEPVDGRWPGQGGLQGAGGVLEGGLGRGR